MESDRVKKIEVFENDGTKVAESTKHFSFPKRYVGSRVMEDLLYIKKKGLPQMKKGTAVSVILHMRDGGRLGFNCIVSLSISEQLNLSLTAPNAENKEKRRFYKVKTLEICNVIKYERDRVVYRYISPVTAKILDINIGGIFLEIDKNYIYEKGDLLYLTMILGTKKLEVKLKILRIQEIAEISEIESDESETDESEILLGYGCVFEGLTAAQEDDVAYYINQVQITNRHKDKTFN